MAWWDRRRHHRHEGSGVFQPQRRLHTERVRRDYYSEWKSILRVGNGCHTVRDFCRLCANNPERKLRAIAIGNRPANQSVEDSTIALLAFGHGENVAPVQWLRAHVDSHGGSNRE